MLKPKCPYLKIFNRLFFNILNFITIFLKILIKRIFGEGEINKFNFVFAEEDAGFRVKKNQVSKRGEDAKSWYLDLGSQHRIRSRVVLWISVKK